MLKYCFCKEADINMFFNKHVKRIDIENYYLADTIFITNGINPSYKVIQKDRIIIKEKYKNIYIYKDIINGETHDIFSGQFSNIHSWNTKFLIKGKLIDYYPNLISTKITNEEAIKLFDNHLANNNSFDKVKTKQLVRYKF